MTADINEHMSHAYVSTTHVQWIASPDVADVALGLAARVQHQQETER